MNRPYRYLANDQHGMQPQPTIRPFDIWQALC